MIQTMYVRSGSQAITAARSLLEDCEPGENPEYERALVDLVVRLYSGSLEYDGADVRAALFRDPDCPKCGGSSYLGVHECATA